jgi:hypothetical protein
MFKISRAGICSVVERSVKIVKLSMDRKIVHLVLLHICTYVAHNSERERFLLCHRYQSFPLFFGGGVEECILWLSVAQQKLD